MFFFQMGILNARRNLKRSLIALTAMAVAAAFFTHSLGLNRGYPLLYKADCRTIIGGEIIAYAHQFGGSIPEGESRWHYINTPQNPLTDLGVFRPELQNYGYLSRWQESAAFSEEDQKSLLREHPEFAAVYPRYQLPSFTVHESLRQNTPLHGRDASLDALLVRSPQQLIVTGRWFEPEDDGTLVAVVSQYQNLPEGKEVPQVGTKIVVEIPRVRYVNDELTFIGKEPLSKEFTVIGQLCAVAQYNEAGGEVLPVPWALDEIQIPLTTWRALWSEAGGKEYQPEQLTLLFHNLSYLQDKVSELRLAHPEFSFFSAPEMLDQAEARGLLDRRGASATLTSDATAVPEGLSLDARAAMSLLLFVNAALILAAHQLILASDRRREIMILKSLGASQMQIIAMVLAEAALITLIGNGCGFLVFRFPAVMIQLSNAISIGAILQGVLNDLVLLVLVSLIFVTFFSLIPATRMASLVAAEVVGGDG